MEKRYLIAKVIASVATICSVVGVIMNIAVGGVFSNTLMGIGVLGALISYVFGGLLKAILPAGDLSLPDSHGIL